MAEMTVSCYSYPMTHKQVCVTQTVEIPADHRLFIDVPSEIPAGRAVLAFTLTPERKSPEQRVTDDDGLYPDGECPICSAKGYMPNAETIAAIEEGRAILRGEIPSPQFNTIEEFFAELRS